MVTWIRSMVGESWKYSRIASKNPQPRNKLSLIVTAANSQLKKCFDSSTFLVMAAMTIILAGMPMDAKISTPYPSKKWPHLLFCCWFFEFCLHWLLIHILILFWFTFKDGRKYLEVFILSAWNIDAEIIFMVVHLANIWAMNRNRGNHLGSQSVLD